MARNHPYHAPNPKYAITFGVISMVVLMLPLFWSPVDSQPITPLARETPRTVSQVLSRPSGFVGPMQPAAPQDFTTEETQAVVFPERHQADPSFEFASHLRRAVISLLVVILLIGVTLKLLQKHLPALAGKSKTKSFMEVLGRETVGPGQTFTLVKVGPKILLVGLTEQSMTTLCEFSESEWSLLLAQEAELQVETPEKAKVYGSILKHYLSIVPGMGAKK